MCDKGPKKYNYFFTNTVRYKYTDGLANRQNINSTGFRKSNHSIVYNLTTLLVISSPSSV